MMIKIHFANYTICKIFPVALTILSYSINMIGEGNFYPFWLFTNYLGISFESITVNYWFSCEYFFVSMKSFSWTVK